MSGPSIARIKLVSYEALTDLVPASRIKFGVLPLGSALPAISLGKISGSQSNNVAMNSTKYMVTDRVQVTVSGKSIKEVEQVLAQVRAALPNMAGAVGNFTVKSILLDLEGPDLDDQKNKIHSRTQDFRIKYAR